MSDVWGWKKRQQANANAPLNPGLFFVRESASGGIELCTTITGQCVAKPITRKQAVEMAEQLLHLATRNWE